ncbi:SDR family oxidoreductase [Streptomyces rubrogriseus]|uniref:SDR family oxidoreductase n=1 Tax=Streptomyces rubrogriseus TaxID=194673 RepID=A0A6G3TAS4_9ACTN|nr:SDR family oxidoreductase [Streptomyces rubrogriseus]
MRRGRTSPERAGFRPGHRARFGSPEDVGAVAAFLASERACYIIGTTINVDSGPSRTIF